MEKIRQLATDHWLLITDHWLLATGNWLIFSSSPPRPLDMLPALCLITECQLKDWQLATDHWQLALACSKTYGIRLPAVNSHQPMPHTLISAEKPLEMTFLIFLSPKL